MLVFLLSPPGDFVLLVDLNVDVFQLLLELGYKFPVLLVLCSCGLQLYLHALPPDLLLFQQLLILPDLAFLVLDLLLQLALFVLTHSYLELQTLALELLLMQSHNLLVYGLLLLPYPGLELSPTDEVVVVLLGLGLYHQLVLLLAILHAVEMTRRLILDLVDLCLQKPLIMGLELLELILVLLLHVHPLTVT